MGKFKKYLEEVIYTLEHNSEVAPELQERVNGMLEAYKNMLEILNKYHNS